MEIGYPPNIHRHVCHFGLAAYDAVLRPDIHAGDCFGVEVGRGVVDFPFRFNRIVLYVHVKAFFEQARVSDAKSKLLLFLYVNSPTVVSILRKDMLD